MRLGVDFITVLRLICTLRPTFEKLFRGVDCALRCVPKFNRAISMICAGCPTFMKSTRCPSSSSYKIHMFKIQGWDSPTLKLCYLSFLLLTFQWKTLLQEKTVIVELGESQPRWIVINLFKSFLWIRIIVKQDKLEPKHVQRWKREKTYFIGCCLKQKKLFWPSVVWFSC